MRSRRNDLEEHFVLLDHAKLVARVFLDGLESLLEIADLGVERAVALLQPGVRFLLLQKLALETPYPQPPALPEPKRILQQQYEGGESQRKYSHLIW